MKWWTILRDYGVLAVVCGAALVFCWLALLASGAR